MKTISELKQDIASKLHGTELSSIYNIDSIINQSIAEVLSNLDIPESKRIEQVEKGIVGGITRYKAPKYLKGSKIIALKKFRTSKCDTGCEGSDIHHAFINHVMPSYQDYDCNTPNLSIEYVNGEKFIKVKGFEGSCSCSPCQSSNQLIHSFDTFSCDYCSDRGCEKITPSCGIPVLCCGQTFTNAIEAPCNKNSDCKTPPEWRTEGRAGNLTINCNDYLTGKGSTSIDISECCGDPTDIYTGSIDIKNLCPFSIDDYKCGYISLAIKIPNPKEIMGITLKFGQSNTDYYSTTINNLKGGWQVLQFRLDNLSRVGMPNMSEIKWLNIEFGTTGIGQSGILIDSLFLSKGTAYNIEYYADTIVMDSNNEYKSKFTEETDLINIEADTYNILLDEILLLCSQELQGGDSRADMSYASQRLQARYALYKENHKSEMQPIIHYYV